MKIRPFSALRPPADQASIVASPPYDVIDSDEARALAAGNEQSFLHIIKPEIDLPEGTDVYADEVYAKAAENFQAFQENGWLVPDEEAAVYLYRQSFNGHSQTGLVALCSTDEYENDIIKKHEKTLQKKEDDRTRHVATLQANAGPVFLMYRSTEAVKAKVREIQAGDPDVDFTSPDGVQHTTWRVADAAFFVDQFVSIPAAYVADGHHRSASASRCGKEMAAANPHHTGEENYNWFLNVLFPADELQVLPYNRLIKDLNGLTLADILAKIYQDFHWQMANDGVPTGRGDIRMYLDGAWYKFTPKIDEAASHDPVESLDVSILQKCFLGPVLGIEDPRTSTNIAFKGGYDCVDQLKTLVDRGKFAAAFSLYPTSTEEIMAVADAGLIMPPKSTWFEPKLRSGLFVNTLSD